MLIVAFYYYFANCHYAECHYAVTHNADSHYTECHYADNCYADSCFSDSHYADIHCADSHYAECDYADSSYAECRGPSNAIAKFACNFSLMSLLSIINTGIKRFHAILSIRKLNLTGSTAITTTTTPTATGAGSPSTSTRTRSSSTTYKSRSQLMTGKTRMTCGLYNKHTTSVNDNSSVVSVQSL